MTAQKQDGTELYSMAKILLQLDYVPPITAKYFSFIIRQAALEHR
jgi:hypothetical protein